MSFYKHYPNRKDHRKAYRDSRRFDASCCNNKSCGYCVETRTYQDRKARKAADQQLKEWEHGTV